MLLLLRVYGDTLATLRDHQCSAHPLPCPPSTHSAQEPIIAEHRLLATLLSEAVPERLGVYLPFAVSGFKPASSFLPGRQGGCK